VSRGVFSKWLEFLFDKDIMMLKLLESS
jgi:hypothetical protein